MIPLLIIYKAENDIYSFLEDFVRDNKINSHFVSHIHPIKSDISIEQIRDIKKEVEIMDTHTRLFIIHSFHTAGVEAQNAFLKTLEEKSANNIFILLATNEHAVLPTIRSRVKLVNLKGDETNISTDLDPYKNLITHIQEGASYAVLSNPLTAVTTNEKAEYFLNMLLYYFRSQLTKDFHSVSIIKKILSQKNLLTSNNLNPQLAVDIVILYICRNYHPLANEKKRSNN